MAISTNIWAFGSEFSRTSDSAPHRGSIPMAVRAACPTACYLSPIIHHWPPSYIIPEMKPIEFSYIGFSIYFHTTHESIGNVGVNCFRARNPRYCEYLGPHPNQTNPIATPDHWNHSGSDPPRPSRIQVSGPFLSHFLKNQAALRLIYFNLVVIILKDFF